MFFDNGPKQKQIDENIYKAFYIEMVTLSCHRDGNPALKVYAMWEKGY